MHKTMCSLLAHKSTQFLSISIFKCLFNPLNSYALGPQGIHPFESFPKHCTKTLKPKPIFSNDDVLYSQTFSKRHWNNSSACHIFLFNTTCFGSCPVQCSCVISNSNMYSVYIQVPGVFKCHVKCMLKLKSKRSNRFDQFQKF